MQNGRSNGMCCVERVVKLGGVRGLHDKWRHHCNLMTAR